MPQLVSDSSDMLTSYLGNSQTYQDILHRNWINLRPLLEHDFSDKAALPSYLRASQAERERIEKSKGDK